MAHKYRLIPSQDHLLRVAVPIFLNTGSASEDGSFMIHSKREEIFEYVMNKKYGIWGVDICEHQKTMFVGPRVRANIPVYDQVVGIDNVQFDAFTGDLEFSDDDEAQIAHTIEPCSRDIWGKIKSKALFDYSSSVKDGSELIQHYGIRTTSKVDIYGYKDIMLTPNQSVVMLVCVPNNREQDPCILKTFLSSKCSLDHDIEKAMAMITLSEKEYHNFYLFVHTAEESEWCTVGFLDLSCVLPLYYAHTGVYLQGARDHHELAGLVGEIDE